MSSSLQLTLVTDDIGGRQNRGKGCSSRRGTKSLQGHDFHCSDIGASPLQISYEAPPSEMLRDLLAHHREKWHAPGRDHKAERRLRRRIYNFLKAGRGLLPTRKGSQSRKAIETNGAVGTDFATQDPDPEGITKPQSGSDFCLSSCFSKPLLKV